ncbi:MAG: hypothetical protein HZB38_15540 [Planctomycetes bacterium]|nr:hypothetical protein [Planctomycetota bacterium]
MNVDPPANPGPPAERIDFDQHCSQCGYNLRGSARNGKCGECGSPVFWAARPELAFGAEVNQLTAKRGATAAILMLLPWFWCPLTWPFFAWAAWRLTTPHSTRASGDSVFQRLPVRIALLAVLFFVGPGVVASLLRLRGGPGAPLVDYGAEAGLWAGQAALLAWLGFHLLLTCACFHYFSGGRARWWATLLSLSVIVSAVGLALLAWDLTLEFTERSRAEPVATAIAAVLAPLALIPFAVALLGVRQRLAVALAGAESIQENRLSWQQAVPGQRESAPEWPSPARTTPEA